MRPKNSNGASVRVGGRGSVVAALVAMALALALASPVSAASVFTTARGPSTVHPGRAVTFRASGMLPLARTSVTVQPSECVGSNGCAARVPGSWRSDAEGRVRVRFHFPYRYFKGCAGSECAEQPLFVLGEHVQVQVCVTAALQVDEEGDGHLCAVRSVRIAAPVQRRRPRAGHRRVNFAAREATTELAKRARGTARGGGGRPGGITGR
jgi:hypothetical protein